MTEREIANHEARIAALEKEMERARARIHDLANDRATVQAAAHLKETGFFEESARADVPTWKLLTLFVGACFVSASTAVAITIWIMSRHP